MSRIITSAADAVASQLIQAEKASNIAVLQTAGLSATMMEACIMAKLPLSTGQNALSDIAEAHALSVKLRFHLVRAHQRMAVTASELGYSWTAFGDELPTPDATPPAGAIGQPVYAEA
ncbi:MAG: hypothetical protein JWN66_3071 [Sphingomonas bacterium]|uniref:hypothetical protein n=1 Tax=Sphingomonas bacterium TaxID=1895847 RepID=UPI0026279224|nr:hypothetical protein [Sphingomonas bacterium]MDB5705955.1 hypothetical protein [Sphingomonas bacterium]